VPSHGRGDTPIRLSASSSHWSFAATIAHAIACVQSVLLLALLFYPSVQGKRDLDVADLLAASSAPASTDHGGLSKREGTRPTLAADHGTRLKARLIDPPDFHLSDGVRVAGSGGSTQRASRDDGWILASAPVAAFQPRAPPPTPYTS
jgi:hypothetical protein